MRKTFLFVLAASLASFWSAQAFARCQVWGPPINKYKCLPDKPGQATQHKPSQATQPKSKKSAAPGDTEAAPSGCGQLELTVSCAASGSSVDWINTCSLDCGDGNRYDALAVQKDDTTLSCWHREVPPNRSCNVSVSSGFDSKIVGSVRTAGSCKQTLRGVCAW